MRLGPQQRRALAALATAGRPLTFGQLCQRISRFLRGAPAGPFNTALRSLVGRGLVSAGVAQLCHKGGLHTTYQITRAGQLALCRGTEKYTSASVAYGPLAP